MLRDGAKVTILVADDDPDDRMLMQDAFEENDIPNPLHFVEDGEQLLQYLKREDKFADLRGEPLPGLILLDLNMPRMDGRTALAKIKEDETLCRVPIVALTTSKAEEDVLRIYNLKASGFIIKPTTYDQLLNVVRAVADFWIGVAELPPECRRRAG